MDFPIDSFFLLPYLSKTFSLLYSSFHYSLFTPLELYATDVYKIVDNSIDGKSCR